MPITYLDQEPVAAKRKITYLDETPTTIKPPVSAQDAFLPKRAEVEQAISQRPDSVNRLMEEYNTPYDFQNHPVKSALKPLVTVGKTLAVPFQRAEAGVSGAGLALQRGAGLKEALKEAASGVSGASSPELGDLVRTTGFGGALNEPLAAGAGFMGNLGLSGALTKGLTVKGANKAVQEASKHTPKVMNDKWIAGQAKQGQAISAKLRAGMGNAYDKIYKKVGNVAVDPNKMDDIILNASVDDATLNSVLRDVDRLIPGRIDTVEKAKQVTDILSKRIPQSYYLQGGTVSKGGAANPKISSMNTIGAIKDEIATAISGVDEQAGKTLKELNKLANKKIYPTVKELQRMFGREEIPRTEGVTSIFGGSAGKAAERVALKDIPNIAKQLKKYVDQDGMSELRALSGTAKQLTKNLQKFQARSGLKKLILPASIVGASLGGGNMLLRKLLKSGGD